MSETERVMVDIETLGTEKGAAIISIGAVKFTPTEVTNEFYRNVSLESCSEYGLEIDPGTLDWWLDRDDEVQDVLSGGVDLEDALRTFWMFYGDADEVWARSPSFDCEILSDALERVGIEVPWSFRDERDCRTIISALGDPEIERDGEHHNAVDDARYQARRVGAALYNV